MGEQRAIKIWVNRIDSAWDLVHSRWSPQTHRERADKGLVSENLVKYHLFKNGVKVHEMRSFCFVRVRANGKRRDDCKNKL